MPSDKSIKVLLILNPKAGKAGAKSRMNEIVSLFCENGYIASAYTTEKKGDAVNFVKQFADEHDMIVCCGGDGTLNEIISGIMQMAKQIPVGYIPTGTTNDMAKTLHIPKSIKKAAKVIMSEQPIYQDIGTFNKTLYFSYIASFGAFTKVSYNTPQWLKNKFGHLAYVLDGIKSVGDISPYRLKVTSEGLEEEGEFIFGSVTNSSCVGGVFQLKSENVCLNDGQFEVLLIRKPKNGMELHDSIKGLINQKYDRKNVLFFHSNQLSFQFEKEAAWTIDGEFAGQPINVDIKNLHNAVRVIRKQ